MRMINRISLYRSLVEQKNKKIRHTHTRVTITFFSFLPMFAFSLSLSLAYMLDHQAKVMENKQILQLMSSLSIRSSRKREKKRTRYLFTYHTGKLD